MTWLLLVVPPTVLVTSTISGVFGMAGGMILMGVYALLLPVATAMVLHGVTQLAANGSRAFMLRRHVRWRIVAHYAAGAALAVGVFAWLAVRADRATLLLALGGVPLVVAALPTPRWLRVETPAVAVACGAIATAAQLVAGVSGPLLDIFFVKGELDRFEIIATKAVTQSLGHLLKIGYFTAIIGGVTELPPWLYPLAIACAFAGSRLGKTLLARLDDAQFRTWSARLVMAIGLVYAARGASEWL